MLGRPFGYQEFVALVISLLTVLAMLAGMAALLWFSAVFEARQLGPAAADTPLADPVPDPGAASLQVIEAA